MTDILNLQNLSFTYKGAGQSSLKGIDLDIKPGESVLLLGQTGAGKSTLGTVTVGLAPEFIPGELTGTIVLNGSDVTRVPVSARSQHVGIVFQDFEPQLFSSNVLLETAFYPESLGLSREEISARVKRWLSHFGLTGLERRAPYELSGGQKQRLALSAVSCGETPLVILDEAGSDLDPAGRAVLYRGSWMENQARIVCDCWAEEPEAFDRIVLIDSGLIIADGTPAEVLTDVDMLKTAGVSPPPVVELFQALNLPDPPLDPVEAAQRIRQHFGGSFIPHDVLRDNDNNPELLEIDNVSYRYDRSRPVLEGYSGSVRQGDFIALVGPNGGGKTTLLKLIRGLLKPDRGRIVWRDQEVKAAKLKRLAGEIGYVFQNPDHQLFAETVLDEVSLGVRWLGFDSKEVGERADQALRTVGLDGRENEDPFVLARGDRQKLAVATMLAQKPDLMLFDEPTTGLDAREFNGLMNLCVKLVEGGHTIIAATHNIEVLCNYATRVWVLIEGELVFDGLPHRLFERPDLVSEAKLIEPDVVRISRDLGLPISLTVKGLVRKIKSTGGSG